MQHQVPQFIEKENKIIGPFTLKQFGWIGSAGVIILLMQFFLSGTALIVAAVIILLIAAAMAYAKVGGLSFPRYAWLAFMYFLSGKRFLYEKKAIDPIITVRTKK